MAWCGRAFGIQDLLAYEAETSYLAILDRKYVCVAIEEFRCLVLTTRLETELGEDMNGRDCLDSCTILADPTLGM